MKIVRLNENIKVTPKGLFWEISWPKGADPGVAFFLSEEIRQLTLKGDSLDFPYKIIGCESPKWLYVAARTDVYPLMWRWHWIRYRGRQSWLLTIAFVVHLLKIWESPYGYTEPGELPEFKDIFRRSPNC